MNSQQLVEIIRERTDPQDIVSRETVSPSMDNEVEARYQPDRVPEEVLQEIAADSPWDLSFETENGIALFRGRFKNEF